MSMNKAKKFKIGDKVRFIPSGSEHIITSYEMIDSFRGYGVDNKTRPVYWDEELELIKESEEIMNKNNLKNGDIVTLRNGDRLIYANRNFTDLSDDNNNTLCDTSDLNDDMTCNYHKDNDIVKVTRPVASYDIYERKEEAKKMTVAEICKELGYDVEIIKEEN